MILCTLRLPSGRNLLSAGVYQVGEGLYLFLWCGRAPRRPCRITLVAPAPSHTGAGGWRW